MNRRTTITTLSPEGRLPQVGLRPRGRPVFARFARACPASLMAATLFIASTAPAFAAEPAKDVLDGLNFEGMTGEAGKAQGEPERFRFERGQFDPLECHRFGFAATPYRAKRNGAVVEFEAAHTNAKGERMKWIGRVKDGLLEGEMTYSDSAGKSYGYWFRARLKK
ncbi:MAG: hypothetical protein IT384_02325 [Deltaproteobacteria bacterium]|nr:hypothetical protein [Deltaproteobacteria bacterium]